MNVHLQTGDVFVADLAWLYRFSKGELVETVRATEDYGTIGNVQVHPTTGEVYLLD